MAELTVTFVRRPDTGALYFSPEVWNHPPTAVMERPTMWVRIDDLATVQVLTETLGDVLPRAAGEYVLIRNGQVV